MSKFLMIAGILLAALGITTALMVMFSFGQMTIYGITPEVAVTFLVGGFVTLGLGGVVDAMHRSGGALGDIRERLVRVEAETGPAVVKAAVPVAAAAAAAAVSETTRIPSPVPSPIPSAAEAAGRVFEPMRSRAEEVTASIKSDAEKMIAEARRAAAETSAALDQAKAEIEEALSPEEITIPPGAQMSVEHSMTEVEAEPETEAEPEVTTAEEPEPEMVAEAEVEAEEEQAEDQLYVVEERMIRGRPARVLSDGTVEAETDEGWMRFENLDHLEEYLDAMSPNRA